jgi:hypothetical protein
LGLCGGVLAAGGLLDLMGPTDVHGRSLLQE